MEFLQLLKTVTGQKEFKIENAYFPGEKIESLLKLLKKHVVKIDVQASFLNAGNCPDLVIEYNGPSTGRAIFHGELYSSGEKKLQVKEKREAEKRAAQELKEAIRGMKKESERVRKMLNSSDGKKRFKPFKYEYLGHNEKTSLDACWVDFSTMRAIVCQLGPHNIGPAWYEVELSREASGAGKYSHYFFLPGGRHDSPVWVVENPSAGK